MFKNCSIYICAWCFRTSEHFQNQTQCSRPQSLRLQVPKYVGLQMDCPAQRWWKYLICSLYSQTSSDPVEFHQSCPYWGCINTSPRSNHNLWRLIKSLALHSTSGNELRDQEDLALMIPLTRNGDSLEACTSRVYEWSWRKGKGSEMNNNCKLQVQSKILSRKLWPKAEVCFWEDAMNAAWLISALIHMRAVAAIY